LSVHGFLNVPRGEGPVQAAVLYGSMNADEQLNFEKIYEWSEGARGLVELNTPPQDLARISPVYYLEGIQAAVSIQLIERAVSLYQEHLCPP